MKKKNLILSVLFVVLTMGFISCEKETIDPEPSMESEDIAKRLENFNISEDYPEYYGTWYDPDFVEHEVVFTKFGFSTTVYQDKNFKYYEIITINGYDRLYIYELIDNIYTPIIPFGVNEPNYYSRIELLYGNFVGLSINGFLFFKE